MGPKILLVLLLATGTARVAAQQVLTEAFAGVRITANAARVTAGGEIGLLRAMTPVSALGVGLAVSDVGVSLRPRYRRRPSPAVTLDAGPGIQWVPGRVERLEANGQVLVHDLYGAWAGLVLDLGAGPGWELAAGARAGRTAGLVAYAVGAATAAIYAIVFAASTD